MLNEENKSHSDSEAVQTVVLDLQWVLRTKLVLKKSVLCLDTSGYFVHV